MTGSSGGSPGVPAAPERAPALTYSNRAHEATHPDRLGVRARLFGVAAAPAEKCRVLELGCAGGANLVGMALNIPESKLVGIDLSEREIATGRALVDALGLKNVDLRVMSVLDVTRDLGEFDYIVAHGLYSWVSPEAQTKILSIFGELLAPNGIAYVSYNTLPGFYTRAKARDLMRFHTAEIADPHKKVEQGLASLKWLVDSIGETTTYGREMAAELTLLRSTNESYIFQEHFVDHSSASYFHEVVAAARTQGLQYLVESDATTTPPEALVPLARDLIAKIGDPVRAEQYIDFVSDRRFRATMLCRADRTVNRAMDIGTMAAGYVSSVSSIEGDALDLTDMQVTLVAPQGARAQLGQPLLKLAMGLLAGRMPEPMSIAGLAEAVGQRLAVSPRAAELAEAKTRLPSELAGALLRLSMFGFVKLRGFAPKVTSMASERPLAFPLARLQSKDDATTTNVWHETLTLNVIERAVLYLCDGTRDRAALVAETKASKRDVETALTRLGRVGVLIA